jgi:hypothetical protein
MTNKTNKLTPLQQKIKDNPKSKRQIEALFEYNKAEKQAVDLHSIKRVLADRWLHCQEYDFSNLQTYLDALIDPDHNIEKFGMAYIRLDDLTEIFRLANQQVVREWSDAMDAQEAEEQEEYEAQVDHGAEIIQQLSSVSWNLNRIASQLEKDSKAITKIQPNSELHEKLMRKNTIDMLRGGKS